MHIPGICHRKGYGGKNTQGIYSLYFHQRLFCNQGYAIGKVTEEKILKESIRYIFIKDSFVSAISGKPTYYEAVRGADYLSRKEIKDFIKKMDEGGTDLYQQYLAMGDMVNEVSNL